MSDYDRGLADGRAGLPSARDGNFEYDQGRIEADRERSLPRGAVGGGGAILVILLLIGFVYVLITAVFSFLAAIAGTLVLFFVLTRLKREQAEYDISLGGVFIALVLGFMALNCIAFILDIAFGTRLSVPSMMGLLGEPGCPGPCKSISHPMGANGRPRYMLVNTLGDVYSYTIGAKGAGFGRYLLHAVPGVAIMTYILRYVLTKAQGDAGGLLQLFAAAWIALAVAMVTAFPLMLWLGMWLRDAVR